MSRPTLAIRRGQLRLHGVTPRGAGFRFGTPRPTAKYILIRCETRYRKIGKQHHELRTNSDLFQQVFLTLLSMRDDIQSGNVASRHPILSAREGRIFSASAITTTGYGFPTNNPKRISHQIQTLLTTPVGDESMEIEGTPGIIGLSALPRSDTGSDLWGPRIASKQNTGQRQITFGSHNLRGVDNSRKRSGSSRISPE